MRDLADEVAQEGGFAWRGRRRDGRFAVLVEDLAYRTVKEALANARKHAAAHAMCGCGCASVEDLAGGARSDDGRGFDVSRALDRRGMRLHMGLDSMRERLRLAGGDVSIASAPGKGARVDFAIPLGPSPA